MHVESSPAPARLVPARRLTCHLVRAARRVGICADAPVPPTRARVPVATRPVQSPSRQHTLTPRLLPACRRRPVGNPRLTPAPTHPHPVRGQPGARAARAHAPPQGWGPHASCLPTRLASALLSAPTRPFPTSSDPPKSLYLSFPNCGNNKKKKYNSMKSTGSTARSAAAFSACMSSSSASLGLFRLAGLKPCHPGHHHSAFCFNDLSPFATSRSRIA